MKKIKFGCHSFLNAKPLIQHLLDSNVESLPFEIILGAPAEIAKKLLKGEIDAGFIPSIEFLRNESLSLVPGFSISGRGKVMSVLLVTDKKISDIKTVSVDKRSRTSIVLLKIILEKRFHSKAEFVLEEDECKPVKPDARLIIGDEALPISYRGTGSRGQGFTDLSHEWYSFTGSPFVFAVIASKIPQLSNEIYRVLDESRKCGMKEIRGIAKKEHQSCGITEDEAYDYLKNKMIYNLTAEELTGLEKFQQMAVEIGELKKKREFKFIDLLDTQKKK